MFRLRGKMGVKIVESTEQVVKPSIADIDGNRFMDSVVLVNNNVKGGKL